MKLRKCVLCFLLCAVLLFQLSGCTSSKVVETDKINGATVFHALKKQVDFDSELNTVQNAEDLFEDLPEGATVTLLKGPAEDSDQLGMVEVQEATNLDDAEKSVNNYLQKQYDAVYNSDHESAKKFENVAIWKNNVYVVFCITANYNTTTQIINNTVNRKESATPTTPSTPTTSTKPENFRWRYCGFEGHILYEVQGNSIRYEFVNEDNPFSEEFGFEKYVDGAYTYYYVKDAEQAFVVINDEMIAVCSLADNSGLSTPFGVNIESYIESWGFIEGSDDPLPSNLDLIAVDDFVADCFAEEAYTDQFTYRYYAQSKILHCSNKYCGVSFYVGNDGSITYVEGISLVYQTQYDNAIQTGANYVIVDTM